MTDQNRKIILNPLLNFVTRSMLDGAKIDLIIGKAVSFFYHGTIISAKEFLYKELNIQSRCVKNAKDEDNVFDICKQLNQAAKDNLPVPTFVIFSPSETPTIGEAVSATLVSKVNELSRKIDGFLENATHSGPVWPARIDTNVTINPAPAPTFAVILKNCPANLTSPNARKDFVDKLCPEASGEISELKKSASEWKLVVKSKRAANKIAENAKNSTSGISVSVKSPLFIGILKGVPIEYDENQVKSLVPSCVKVSQGGKSRVFKVYFESKQNLDQFLKVSVKVGYEKLSAQAFVYLPKRCFSCHKTGHLASQCSNRTLCSRCGSCDHTSNSASPCSKKMFCLECKVTGHTCYSVKCPNNNSQLAKPMV